MKGILKTIYYFKKQIVNFGTKNLVPFGNCLLYLEFFFDSRNKGIDITNVKGFKLKITFKTIDVKNSI